MKDSNTAVSLTETSKESAGVTRVAAAPYVNTNVSGEKLGRHARLSSLLVSFSCEGLAHACLSTVTGSHVNF